jgi:hypothetical protein
MGRLLFRYRVGRSSPRLLAALLAGDPSDQLAEERTVFEILSQARVRRRNPVERQHLLDRVRVAEEHHDFLQVRAAHDIPQ